MFPIQRQPLATFTPNTLTKSRTKRRVQLPFHSSMSSLYGMRVVAVGERVSGRDQDSLTQRTSVAPRRARRGCAGCEI